MAHFIPRRVDGPPLTLWGPNGRKLIVEQGSTVHELALTRGFTPAEDDGDDAASTEASEEVVEEEVPVETPKHYPLPEGVSVAGLDDMNRTEMMQFAARHYQGADNWVRMNEPTLRSALTQLIEHGHL